MKIFKTKVSANIATYSLVGILNKDYPLPYGNYFSMSVKKEYQISNLNESMVEEGMGLGFMVCNFNCENFEEAMKRFLSDGNVEITMFQVEDKYPFIAITDERIPEDWYCLWGEDRGYCNGQIHGENYQEVAKTLGKRFGGNENYVLSEKPLPSMVKVNVEAVPIKYAIDIIDNTNLK